MACPDDGGVIEEGANDIGIGARGADADDAVSVSDKTRLVAGFNSVRGSGVTAALRHALGCGDSAGRTCCGGGVTAERCNAGVDDDDSDPEPPNSGDIRIRDDRSGS